MDAAVHDASGHRTNHGSVTRRRARERVREGRASSGAGSTNVKEESSKVCVYVCMCLR